jgi:hypothetical protein
MFWFCATLLAARLLLAVAICGWNADASRPKFRCAPCACWIAFWSSWVLPVDVSEPASEFRSWTGLK